MLPAVLERLDAQAAALAGLAAETGALAGRVAALPPADAGTRSPTPAAAEAAAAFRQDLGLALAEFLARLEQAAAARAAAPAPALAPARLRRRPGEPRGSHGDPRRPAPDARHAHGRAQPPAGRARRAARPPRAARGERAARSTAAPSRRLRGAPRGSVIGSERDAAAALEEFLRSLTQGLDGGQPPARRGRRPPPPPGEVLPFQRRPAEAGAGRAGRCGPRAARRASAPAWSGRCAAPASADLAGLAALEPEALAARLGPLGRLVPARAWIAAARGEAGA